ncbi:MAG: NAD/NADP octopine/nopaline dehydrogenase family protein [Enterocloster sp.]
MEQLWEEKKSVFDVFGFQPAPSVRGMFEGIQHHDPFYDYFCEMDGPGDLLHRYISEDAPLLTCFFISIARGIGVDVPLYESMIRLLSAVTGTDYYRQGRTLENLCLEHLSKEELIAYFCEE